MKTKAYIIKTKGPLHQALYWSKTSSWVLDKMDATVYPNMDKELPNKGQWEEYHYVPEQNT